MTDATGAAIEEYVYDAFGNAEISHGPVNAYRYAGEYFDDTIGLQYNRARWYDATVGRFLSQDQFAGLASQPITLNKYVYASNMPTDYVDPGGMMSSASLGAGGSISATMGSMVTVNLIRVVGTSKSVAIALGSTPFVASQAPRIVQTLQGTGASGFRALQSSIYAAPRVTATASQIQNALNVGAGYTNRLNDIMGVKASKLGLEIHKLIEASAREALINSPQPRSGRLQDLRQ